MPKSAEFVLRPDKKGVVWDLLLYVPTVMALVLIGIKLWYGGKEGWGYLLEFLATFFFLVGANRILTRLQILPTAPVKLLVDKNKVRVELKKGEKIDLVKNVKFYSDYAGRSFAISGLDGQGVKRQFVFHKGQFDDERKYTNAQNNLRVFA